MQQAPKIGFIRFTKNGFNGILLDLVGMGWKRLVFGGIFGDVATF